MVDRLDLEMVSSLVSALTGSKNGACLCLGVFGFWMSMSENGVDKVKWIFKRLTDKIKWLLKDETGGEAMLIEGRRLN